MDILELIIDFMMDYFELVVGGIIIGIGLLLKFIGEKTGYDFNDPRFFRAPEHITEVALDPKNPIGDEV